MLNTTAPLQQHPVNQAIVAYRLCQPLRLTDTATGSLHPTQHHPTTIHSLPYQQPLSRVIPVLHCVSCRPPLPSKWIVSALTATVTSTPLTPSCSHSSWTAPGAWACTAPTQAPRRQLKRQCGQGPSHGTHTHTTHSMSCMTLHSWSSALS